MKQLWVQVKDNLSFLLVSLLIVAALAFLARLAERLLPQKRRVSGAKRVSIIGVCSALAAVLYLLDFPLVFLAPEFYKIDFSELPVLLCGFFLGPSAAVSCEAVKTLLKLLLKGTTTAFVGDFANFVVGCALVLIAGSAVMTVFGSLFNAVYLLPKFAELYGLPLDAIVAMGSKINGNIHNVSSLVLLAVAPLNLIKSSLVSILTMLLYKRVEKPLFRCE